MIAAAVSLIALGAFGLTIASALWWLRFGARGEVDL